MNRPPLSVALAASAIALLFTPCDGLGETARHPIQPALDWITQLIERQGSAGAKLALREVTIRVTDEAVPSARISQYIGSSTIYLTLPKSYYDLLEGMTEANILLGPNPAVNVAIEAFYEHVADVVVENRRRMFMGLAVQRIPQPEVFARARPSCAALAACYPFDETDIFLRDAQVAEALLLTVLHELGHVAEGHRALDESLLRAAKTDAEKQQIFLQEMKRSREQEIQADEWAAWEVLRLGLPPVKLLSGPLIQTMLASSGFDPRQEKIDSHPIALHRVLRVVEIMRAHHRQKYGKLPPPELESILQGFERLAEKAANEFERLAEEAAAGSQ